MDDVCDLITQGSYDLVFLTETWLRPTGSKCEMAAVTPPGFTLKSVPRANGIGRWTCCVVQKQFGGLC